jgi:integrase
MDKRDPYDSKNKWKAWISNNPKINNTLEFNSNLIIQFLKDFELGQNIHKKSKRGERSPIRLLALKSRLSFFAQQFNKKKFVDISKTEIHQLFKDMNEGTIKKNDGKPYLSVSSYVKDWKTFYHWLLKVGKVKEDINDELSRTEHKPAWVYLDEEQFKTFANQCNFDYKPIVYLFLDSGARVTELFSVKINDFSDDFTKLHIRPETSKNNYERTLNLKLCSGLIKEYVKFHNLKDDDFLIQKKTTACNKYLKEKCIKIFGEGPSNSKSKGKFSEFSLYDIRHIASTYWLKRYQSHSSLMYRMGWTSERFIKYYSEFLGQNDKLSDEDMITGEDRDKLTRISVEVEQMKEQFENLKKAMVINAIGKAKISQEKEEEVKKAIELILKHSQNG